MLSDCDVFSKVSLFLFSNILIWAFVSYLMDLLLKWYGFGFNVGVAVVNYGFLTEPVSFGFLALFLAYNGHGRIGVTLGLTLLFINVLGLTVLRPYELGLMGLIS